MIDTTDEQILNILQKEARVSNVDIARQVDLAPSAVLERIRKLEERGLVKGYTTRLDARELGFGLTAFVFVRTEDRCGETAEALAGMPEVQEVHHVAGEDCYLIKVRVKDADSLGHMLRERLGGIKAVRSTRTTVVLQTVKETSDLPLAAGSKTLHATNKRTLHKAAVKRGQRQVVSKVVSKKHRGK